MVGADRDTRSRRAPDGAAGLGLAHDVRLFGNRVGLPDLLARRGVQGHQGTAACAAFVRRAHRRTFFASSHGHEDTVAVDDGSTDDLGARMSVHMHLPEQCAGGGIHGIRIGALIAEEGGLARHANGRADRRFGFERPVLTAGLRVERIDLAIGAGNEDAPTGNSRLAVRGERIGERERPFQLQLRDLRGGQPGGLPGLKAGVGKVGTPTIPGGTAEREFGMAGAQSSLRGRWCTGGLSG